MSTEFNELKTRMVGHSTQMFRAISDAYALGFREGRSYEFNSTKVLKPVYHQGISGAATTAVFPMQQCASRLDEPAYREAMKLAKQHPLDAGAPRYTSTPVGMFDNDTGTFSAT